MKDGPAFQLYASDFYLDTVEWSVEEVGIYNRLLHAQWVNGSLPNNEIRLARIAGCGTRKFQKGWTTIQFKFHLNGNGRLINERLEKTREKQRKYREMQKEKSKKGVKARQSTGKPTGNPLDKPKGKPLHSSSSIKEKIYKKERSDKKSRKIELPQNYKLEADHIEYAKKKGLKDIEIKPAFEEFCIYHRKMGSIFVDWYAAWQTWVRKAIEFKQDKLPQLQSQIGVCPKHGTKLDLDNKCSMCAEEKISPEERERNRKRLVELAKKINS
jgi:uncharacterized protein YdaU (DUF1376 family)